MNWYEEGKKWRQRYINVKHFDIDPQHDCKFIMGLFGDWCYCAATNFDVLLQIQNILCGFNVDSWIREFHNCECTHVLSGDPENYKRFLRSCIDYQI